MDQREKVRENRLRRMAHRLGLDVNKSRVRSIHTDDFGGYMIVSREGNSVVAGEKHDLSLNDVERVLKAVEEKIRRARKV